MRVLLVGVPANAQICGSMTEEIGIVVDGEFETLGDARASGVRSRRDPDRNAARPGRGTAAGRSRSPARETEVLELLAEGLSNKGDRRAARHLRSDGEVPRHASIGGKLGAANRTDAVRLAVRARANRVVARPARSRGLRRDPRAEHGDLRARDRCDRRSAGRCRSSTPADRRAGGRQDDIPSLQSRRRGRTSWFDRRRQDARGHAAIP